MARLPLHFLRETNSTIKLCFSWVYFHLWIIPTNFKWLNSCRKPENMRIQEILPTQKLIHRRQVTGYPIATQCCIWYRDQSFECSANQMTGFYMWIEALGWNELIILVVKKTLNIFQMILYELKMDLNELKWVSL